MALKYLYVPSGVQANKAYGVLPNSANADFDDFTRNSAGSRVDENGLIDTGLGLSSELVTNGNFATDSGWTKGTGWSISGGKANCNGSQSGNANIYQAITFSVGKIYKVSFDVSNYVSGTVKIVFGDTGGTVMSANGNYVQYFTFASGTNFYIQGNSSFIGSIDNVSVREVTPINTNVPRLDYSDGSCPSLLLEPSRTNYLPNSEDFTQWTKLNGGTGSLPIVTSNNTISPNGTQNADKIVLNKGNATSNSDYSLIRLDYGGSDVDGTASVYLKSDVNVDVEISSDDISYQTISVTTNWKRFEVSDATSDRLSMGLRGTIPSTQSATIYSWGAQLEQGSYATSYIPTFGTVSTRAADVAGGTGDLSSVINSTEGVLYAEISALANDGTFRQLTLSDGSTSNRVSIDFTSTDNQIRSFSSSNGSTVANMSDTVSNVNELNKVAVKYKLNDYALWINGVEVATDTIAAAPIGLSELSFDNGGGFNDFYGNIKDVRVYNTALTDTELQALTTI